MSSTTILLPSQNQADRIRAIINMILLRIPDISIVVIDYASTDNTKGLIDYFHQRYNNVMIFEKTAQDSQNITGCVVQSINIVNTTNLIYMDSQVVQPVGYIQSIIRSLDQGADIVVLDTGRKQVMSKDSGFMSLLGLSKDDTTTYARNFFGVRSEAIRDIVLKRGDQLNLKSDDMIGYLLKYRRKLAKVFSINYSFGLLSQQKQS